MAHFTLSPVDSHVHTLTDTVVLWVIWHIAHCVFWHKSAALLFMCLTFSSSMILASSFLSRVTAPDCLIPSWRIGDIRPNPVPTSPESQRRGSAGMKSSGTAGISQCAGDVQRKEEGFSPWALRSRHFSPFAGSPAIQQVQTDAGATLSFWQFWVFRLLKE